MRPPARETSRKTSIKPRISKVRLKGMIEEATVDCHDESEQVTGWFTMLDEHLAVPFETKILGVSAIVERVNLNRSEQIIAVEAYRHWRGAG